MSLVLDATMSVDKKEVRTIDTRNKYREQYIYIYIYSKWNVASSRILAPIYDIFNMVILYTPTPHGYSGTQI